MDKPGIIQVELQDIMASDRRIAESAWVSSTDKNKRENRTDEEVKRVIEFLAEHKHGTPFESVVFRFWIRLPIYTHRQLIKHRLQSENSISGRYRSMPSDYYQMPEDVQAIVTKAGCQEVIEEYKDAIEASYNSYMASLYSLKEAEKDKIITNDEFKRAREIIRGQLPVAGMTECITTMNLRAWCNFYKQRSKPDAQPEIQQVAKLMYEAIKASGKLPIALEALEKQGWSI
jgi:thymidylate synthase (FAD)